MTQPRKTSPLANARVGAELVRTSQEFFVFLCPSEYSGVHWCPLSDSERGVMWRFGLFCGLSFGFDSPRLHL